MIFHSVCSIASYATILSYIFAASGQAHEHFVFIFNLSRPSIVRVRIRGGIVAIPITRGQIAVVSVIAEAKAHLYSCTFFHNTVVVSDSCIPMCSLSTSCFNFINGTDASVPFVARVCNSLHVIACYSRLLKPEQTQQRTCPYTRRHGSHPNNEGTNGRSERYSRSEGPRALAY